MSQSPSTAISLNSPDVVRNVIESKLFDGSSDRKIALSNEFGSVDEVNNASSVSDDGSSTDLTEIVCNSDKLSNSFDDSVVMDNFLIHQNSNSITEYVEDFMYVKNRAEFIFKQEFSNDFLAYCFVEGLDNDIRETLELWTPQTLQEAIYLATFQESLLEECLLAKVMDVENEVGRQLVNDVSVKTFGCKENGDDTIMKSGPLEVVGGENLVALSKLLVAEKMPWIILTKMEESVLAFIDIPAGVIDSQKPMTRDVVVMDDHFMMQIINEPTSTGNAYGLGMKSNNICEELFFIFDLGGDVRIRRPAGDNNLFTNMIGSKDLILEEITLMSVISACGHLSEFKEHINFHCTSGNSFKGEAKSDVQIGSYAAYRIAEEGMKFLVALRKLTVQSTYVSLISVLKACAYASLFSHAKKCLHSTFRPKLHNSVKLARRLAWKKQLKGIQQAERLAGRPCTRVIPGCTIESEGTKQVQDQTVSKPNVQEEDKKSAPEALNVPCSTVDAELDASGKSTQKRDVYETVTPNQSIPVLQMPITSGYIFTTRSTVYARLGNPRFAGQVPWLIDDMPSGVVASVLATSQRIHSHDTKCCPRNVAAETMLIFDPGGGTIDAILVTILKGEAYEKLQDSLSTADTRGFDKKSDNVTGVETMLIFDPGCEGAYEEVVPSIVIPNHLQVQNADCSHLSFGSFGSAITGYSDPFAYIETDAPPIGHSDTRNSEYCRDEVIKSVADANLVHRTGGDAAGFDSPSAPQEELLRQEHSEVAHGNPYTFPSFSTGYTLEKAQHLNGMNASYNYSRTSTQMQNITPFSSSIAALSSTMLTTNAHPVRETELPYSPFPMSESMPNNYGNTVSAIGGSSISVAEALKIGFQSVQSTQQNPSGTSVATGPAAPQHLAVHPYSQPTLPLGPFANMISYPFLSQSYKVPGGGVTLLHVRRMASSWYVNDRTIIFDPGG